MKKRILTEIWIYPVKGLGGIRMRSSPVKEKGLQHDRRWMLIDENNNFIMQRVCHPMALMRLSIHEASFEISFHGDSINLPFRNSMSGPLIHATIWNDSVATVEVSKEHSQWFSDHLGINCRLVAFPEDNTRPVDLQYAINNENVSLADGYPFLVIGQATLDDLNSRLKEPVPMNRFRPNLVFSGGDPFEEDDWKEFTIGKNRFAGVKPCARCIVTTINQETAEAGREPLVTLSRYRRKEGEIYFGQNVLAIDHNEIFEGDEISVE